MKYFLTCLLCLCGILSADDASQRPPYWGILHHQYYSDLIRIELEIADKLLAQGDPSEAKLHYEIAKENIKFLVIRNLGYEYRIEVAFMNLRLAGVGF